MRDGGGLDIKEGRTGRKEEQQQKYGTKETIARV